MPKRSLVAIALLLASCGRSDDPAVGKPQVHYLLDESGTIMRPRVATTTAPGDPASKRRPSAPRATPNPDTALIAVQEHDMAAELAREKEESDQGEPVNTSALNYAIFSGSVLGN